MKSKSENQWNSSEKQSDASSVFKRTRLFSFFTNLQFFCLFILKLYINLFCLFVLFYKELKTKADKLKRKS